MTTMTLKHVKVMSIAKWLSLPLAIMGVFAAVIYCISLIYSGEGSLSLVIFYFISLPLEYAFVGFIAAVISGLIYNATAKNKGGIVLRFEFGSGDSAALEALEEQ
jgi:hypothetical protein